MASGIGCGEGRGITKVGRVLPAETEAIEASEKICF